MLRSKLYSVSAPCSTGKSYAACQFIREHWHESNFLYVAPSKLLLQERERELRALGVTCAKITEDEHPKAVRRHILLHLKEARSEGHVLLITWNAYVDLPYFHRREHWSVIIDEIPQLDTLHKTTLPKNPWIITDNLNASASRWDGILLVTPKNHRSLRKLLEGPRDDVIEGFRPIFTDALSKNKSLFVDARVWERIIVVGDIDPKVNSRNTLYFLSMLRPEPFRGCVLLGANIEDGMLAHWLHSTFGQIFTRHNAIASKLRPVPPSIGQRISILYFLDRPHFSKHQRNEKLPDGRVRIDAMDDLAIQHFGEAGFLYVENNDRASIKLKATPNANKMPVISHGLNCFDMFHNIYFSAALNREPKHIKMLERLGIPSDVIQRSTSQETTYQAVMRTSLRKYVSSEPVQIVVPDRGTATRLSQLLECQKPRKLGALDIARLNPLTASQRRDKRVAKLVKDFIADPKLIRKFLRDEKRNIFGSSLTNKEDNNGGLFVTFHSKVNTSRPADHDVIEMSVRDLASLFKKLSRDPITEKKDAFLFTPALYLPPDDDSGYRKKDWWAVSSFMALDFDRGELTPEKFIQIFWDHANKGTKRSFLIFNSFSRSPDKPNRFRVVLFYKRFVTRIEEHQAVYDMVLKALQINGFSEESSGLDRNCRSGCLSFYVPCTNRLHPNWAFFEARGIKRGDFDKYAIDPRECDTPEAVVPNLDNFLLTSRILSEKEIERATAKLRSMSEGRHSQFFLTGMHLAHLGAPAQQIEAVLYECAGTEQHMRRKVHGIMKSLERYGLLQPRFDTNAAPDWVTDQSYIMRPTHAALASNNITSAS